MSLLRNSDYQKNSDFVASLASCMEPKFIVFLSVDLAGSTKIKQKQHHWDIGSNVETRSSEAKRYFGQGEWFFFLSEFYTKFKIVFVEELRRVYLQYSERYAERTEHPPARNFQHFSDRLRRWKLIGDEIVFTMDVQTKDEVTLVSMGFRNALIVFRKILFHETDIFESGGARDNEYLQIRKKQYEHSSLDVKGTIWSAGFPISNREVVVDAPNLPDSQDFLGEDPYLRNLFLVEKSRQVPIGEPSPYTQDFIGPSVDTGFRLSSIANPRKLIVSAEIAFIVAQSRGLNLNSLSAGCGLKRDFCLGFDGRKAFKGVAGGSAYPVFWIDSGTAEGLSVLEDDLLPRNTGIDLEKVEEYLATFFRRQYLFLRTPTILDPLEDFVATSLCRAIHTHNQWWIKMRSEMIARYEPQLS